MSSSREDTRGLFVLGVIAVLVVLRYAQSFKNPLAGQLIDILLLFWVGYAVLMVIWLSQDIFGRRIGQACHLIGLFALGCAVCYCFSFSLLYFLVSPVVNLLFPLSLAGQHFHSILEALIFMFAETLALTLVVSILGLVIALYVPPVLVAWGMSRAYGRKVWLICAGTIILISAGLFIH